MQQIHTLKTTRLHLPLICHHFFDCLTSSAHASSSQQAPWKHDPSTAPSNSICCQMPWFPRSQGAAGDQVRLPRCRPWKPCMFTSLVQCLKFDLRYDMVYKDIWNNILFILIFIGDVCSTPKHQTILKSFTIHKTTHTAWHSTMESAVAYDMFELQRFGSLSVANPIHLYAMYWAPRETFQVSIFHFRQELLNFKIFQPSPLLIANVNFRQDANVASQKKDA